MDDIIRLERVQMLAFLQVPEHSDAVLATRSAERAVRRHGHGVEIAGVVLQVGAQLAVGEVPYLDELVPAAGDDERVLCGRGKADAGHPFGVTLIMDGVLAFAEGIPQLDGAITRARHDLTVIGREGDGKHVLGMANEAAGGVAGREIPEAEGVVPGGGEGELAVRGEDDVGDEVAVATKGALRIAVGALLLCVGGELPHDDGLVTRGGDNGVGVVDGGGEGSDPAGVALEIAAKSECFRHGVVDSQGIARTRRGGSEKVRELLHYRLWWAMVLATNAEADNADLLIRRTPPSYDKTRLAA